MIAPMLRYIREVLDVAGDLKRAILWTELPFVQGCCLRGVPPKECWAVIESDIIVDPARCGGL